VFNHFKNQQILALQTYKAYPKSRCRKAGFYSFSFLSLQILFSLEKTATPTKIVINIAAIGITGSSGFASTISTVSAIDFVLD